MKNIKSIAELVHEYTFFPSGKYHHYLSIVELNGLFHRIIQTNETTKYVQAIPFYKTTYAQEEFDHYMFFCKKLEKGENAEKFLRDCTSDEYGIPYKGVFRCYEDGDIQTFQKALEDYLLYLNELVHDVYAFLAEQCDIKGADVLLGSLCFEVNAE